MAKAKKITTAQASTEATAPAIEEIKNRFTAYETHYGQLHSQQKDIDDYYELTFDADVPSRYPTRMPSTARDWIDIGVRYYTLDNPKSRVSLWRDSDEARRQVSVLETFYNFWLRQNIAQIKNGAKKVLLRGEGFFKINMDDTYFGSYEGKPIDALSDEERREYERKKLFHFPLFLTTPDPMNIFASPAHFGCVPADVIERFNITVAEAAAICKRNGWTFLTTKAPNETVEWFSYISPEWRYFSIDGNAVLNPPVQINILGFVPYVHYGAGAGQTSYEGKPEYEFRSLLYGKKDMLKMEARMLSQIDAINSRYSWLRYKVKGNPELIKQHYPKGVPTDPDELLIETDQMTIEVLSGEPLPQGLFQQYALLQAQAAPPAILSGARMPGVYSGEQQEGLMATAKPVYKDAFKNIEDALGVAMGMGARIIEQVYKSSVKVRNLTSEEGKTYVELKPSDIKGHYDCEVKLLAETPEANDMRKALGKALRQAGSISKMYELRNYHDMSEEEALDEIAQQIAEATMQEPVIRMAVAKDAAERLGMKRQAEAIEEAERLANQEAQGGGGRKLRSIPPTQEGNKVVTGEEQIRKRGRTSGGAEVVPSPTEQKEGITP